jgi:hypothetical protein
MKSNFAPLFFSKKISCPYNVLKFRTLKFIAKKKVNLNNTQNFWPNNIHRELEGYFIYTDNIEGFRLQTTPL